MKKKTDYFKNINIYVTYLIAYWLKIGFKKQCPIYCSTLIELSSVVS